MRHHKLTSRLDSIGMTASTLCAIHCAAVPLLITLLPMAGLSFLANPWIEWSMIALALVIGVSSISLSYFRTHQRILPVMMLLAGFFVIILGHMFTKGWPEAIIVPTGGLIIASAHFINYKYAGACQNGEHILHLTHTHRHEEA